MFYAFNINILTPPFMMATFFIKFQNNITTITFYITCNLIGSFQNMKTNDIQILLSNHIRFTLNNIIVHTYKKLNPNVTF